MVEQQDRFSRLRIAHFDPAWIAGDLVGDIALDTVLGQFVVRQSEQVFERFRREPRDTKSHLNLLYWWGIKIRAPCVA